jgi:hypothetical protein
MIPLKDKDKEWEMDNMDALETIASAQRNSNLSLIENYQMIKGKFFFNHYVDDPGYSSMLGQLSQEFEIPNYLKHYDIISPVVNTLLGEWTKRPDTFRVKDWSDNGTSEFERKRNELLLTYVQETINIEINKTLVNSGLLEIQPQSEEEAADIQAQIESIRSSMTPPEIESYMKTDFRTASEIWAENRLSANIQRFNLKEKERREFEDMLVASRCFRHTYLTSNGYDIETWNPIHVFYNKSPEIQYVEDGDYVGRQFVATIADIIDRYGFMMTDEELETLQGEYKKNKTKWKEHPSGRFVYDNYMVPFHGYPGWKIAHNNLHPYEETTGIPEIDLKNLTSQNDGFFNTGNGFYMITEAYWKTQEKLSLICYIDPETGLKSKTIVDENAIIPKQFKRVDSLFSEDLDPFTYTSTYVNRVYKGIKINLGNREQSLYFVKPNEFQFKGDINLYNCKLPVCGQIFNTRNSEPMSLVDLMKPHQIGYNVAMNQLYNYMEKEVSAFMIFDVNMFVNSKDWGGEDNWAKWMGVAQSLGMVPIDTSPQNINSAASAAGGQFPKVIDMDLGARMLSRMNIAKFFEEQALKQVGFNQYRLGSFAGTTSATGVQQGASQSYAQTETYFTQFSNYLRRCRRMELDIAQYVESKNLDVKISYISNDLSNAYIKVLGTDLLLSDLYLFISDSQEQIRQLESIRQLGLNNNTSGASMADLAEIMITNSPQNILRILKESQARQEEMQKRAQDIEREKNQMDMEAIKMKEEKIDERLDKEIEKDIRVAQISAESKLFFNRNYTPTEEDVNELQSSLEQSNLELKKESIDNKKESDSQALATKREIELQKLALQNKKIDAQISKEENDIKYAKIMKQK